MLDVDVASLSFIHETARSRRGIEREKKMFTEVRARMSGYGV